MILRPYGVILDGEIEFGLELFRDGELWALRPHTGIPEPYVVSTAFVNAHSHLEYFGLRGLADSGLSYWPWIRELTKQKSSQADEDVRADCHAAAQLNRATGVAWIEEHSDRPYAGDAMRANQLQGRIYQELITFFEHDSPGAKMELVQERASQNSMSGIEATLNPHAAYTVDRSTLSALGGDEWAKVPFSIHLLESPVEREFFEQGSGPIRDLYISANIPPPTFGISPVNYLDQLGLLRPGVQAVHCCDILEHEMPLLATNQVSVAHCPRSNKNLRCPIAPVRTMLSMGIEVGLGLDSAASSGPIDMFAEMRCALASSKAIGEELSAAQVWRMACKPDWKVGGNSPLLIIHVPSVESVEELIERATPSLVEHI